MNDRFLRALKREPVDCTPVWIMRQAGRYLPEYRAVRRQVPNFMGLCRNPELACEVTMQPLRRFPLDAAILFSDILTIPDAMGLGLHFIEGEGPKFERVVRSAAEVEALPVPDVADSLSYVTDAVRWIRRELNGKVPLIGFSGSPWTLATYMIEGGGGHNFVHCKQMLYRTPEVLDKLLNKLVLSVTDYLLAQAAAGAQALMIFDSWGGVLAHEKYVHFSLTPMQNIIHNVKKIYPDIPVIMFTKGGGQWLEMQAATGAEALGLDWTTNLKTARARVGNQVALQGNLDPQALFGTPKSIEAEVGRILADFGTGSGHVFNLGHGILPSIDPENVAALVEAVHNQSRAYH